MASKNWTVRLDENQAAELRKLITDSGQSANEFMQNVIITEKLRLVARDIPMASSYLQQLQIHVAGIQECYGQLAIGMQAVIDAARAGNDQKLQDAINQLETEQRREKDLAETIAGQEADVKSLGAQLAQAQRAGLDALTRIDELQSANSAFSQLVESLKEANAAFKNDLQDYENSKKLLAAADELNRRLMDEKSRQAAEHRESLLHAKEEYQTAIDRIQGEYAARLSKDEGTQR